MQLAVDNAVKDRAKEMPIIKFLRKQKAGDKDQEGPEQPDFIIGYPHALMTRRNAMNDAGMSTALPSLSKEQKKAEKDKKKPWQMQGI